MLFDSTKRTVRGTLRRYRCDLQIHSMLTITCHWTRFFLPRDTLRKALEFPRPPLPPRSPQTETYLRTLLLNSRENGSRVSPRSIPFPTIPRRRRRQPLSSHREIDSRGFEGASFRGSIDFSVHGRNAIVHCRGWRSPSNRIMDHRCKRIEGR